MTPAGTSATLRLVADIASVTEARHHVVRLLAEWGLADLADDVGLAASELVTNAVLHARTDVEVSLLRHRDGVRLEVADGDPYAIPAARPHAPALYELDDLDGGADLDAIEALLGAETMTGRGMTVVAAVADGWGVERGADGKTVWAEFGTAAAEVDAPATGPTDEPEAPAAAVPPAVAGIAVAAPGGHPASGAADVPLRPVRLTGVPVRLAWAGDANVDDLVREFQVAAAGGDDVHAPAELMTLARRLLDRLAGLRDPGRDAVGAALASGQRLVDLDLSVPLTAPADLWQLVALLEQVAEFAKDGALLSLAPTDELRAFRRWYVGEVERQLRGAPPTPCPFPVLPPDDPELTAAIRAANARLLADRTQRTEPSALVARLQALQTATGLLAEASDVATVASVAVESAVDQLGANRGTLCLLAEDGTTVELVHAVGYEADVTGHWGSFGVSDDVPASEVIRTGEAVFLRTVDERDARYPVFRSTPSTAVGALAVVPVGVGRDRRTGAISVGFGEERAFAVEERAFLGALASAVGQAVERLRLLAAERVARDRLAFLAEASALLNESLAVEHTIQSLAELVVPRIGDWCSVHVLAEGRPRLAGVAHVEPARRALARELHTRWPVSFEGPSAIGRCLRTGEPVRFQVVPDHMLEAVAQDADHLRVLRELGFGSGLVVPLSAGGRVLGALAVANQTGRYVTDDEWDVAQDLAARAGAALANAQLYAEQARAAAALQASLLPARLPVSDVVDFAARYRPVSSGVDIGGDFYDVVTLPDGWLAVVGDVRGHGVDAGAVAALARHSVRGLAAAELPPAELARRLNAILLDQADDDDEPPLCSVVLAAIRPDADGAAVSLCVAGHPDPLVLRADGRLDRPGRQGDILGLRPAPALGESTVRLGPGDALVLYTDGIVERHLGLRFFDDAGVAEALVGATGADARTLADRLVDAATGFVAEPPTDDMAVVVARLADRA